MVVMRPSDGVVALWEMVEMKTVGEFRWNRGFRFLGFVEMVAGMVIGCKREQGGSEDGDGRCRGISGSRVSGWKSGTWGRRRQKRRGKRESVRKGRGFT